MIHFNPETKTFNLLLKASIYAFQADQENRLVHLAWGPRPEGALGIGASLNELDDNELAEYAAYIAFYSAFATRFKGAICIDCSGWRSMARRLDFAM